MSSRVIWSGLDELIETLDNAPDEIRKDAFAIMREATEGAAADLRTGYAQRIKHGTGKLLSHIRTEFPSSTVIIGRLKSVDNKASWFEFGTKQRVTTRGANRGSQTGARIFVEIVQRWRARMYDKTRTMLESHGFTFKD